MTLRSTDDLGRRMVGEVVAENYGRAVVFERYGIDFCCGGDRSVREASEAAGVAYEDLAQDLLDAPLAGVGEADARSWALDELAAHIVAVHHHYVRESLPSLLAFSEKVARVHGDQHGELQEVRALVVELAAELSRHMEAEEGVLFPRVAELIAGEGSAAVAAPLEALEADHEHAGGLMHRMRELSGGYATPDDACTTYRAFYAKLAEFEADLHLHVHLENNVLFPGIRALVEA